MRMPDMNEKATPPCVILWFRNDLRLSDQPALSAAVASGRPVLCIYILETSDALRPPGGAVKFWLHKSLASLDADLQKIGGRLQYFKGDARDIILRIAEDRPVAEVHWCRRYGAAEREIDSALKTALKDKSIVAHSHNGHLLYEPWQVRSNTGEPFKVFTPFWRAARSGEPPAPPLPAPVHIEAPTPVAGSLTLEELGLKPMQPDWSGGIDAEWTQGERGAADRLMHFLSHGVHGYGEGRNRPDLPSTSRLSPHLRFGEISVRQVFQAAQRAGEAGDAPAYDVDKFISEIGWREFSYALLYQFPHLAERNFQARFDAFPWARPDLALLKAWQQGQTGYPIVDAGMRELWQTGYMHNRVRMIAASFLIKHLMVPWQIGEAWFWDTLVDADSANNAASWQWVAGSGADAAPYFRIFNPILQGEKFDPEGRYVQKYVPELEHLDAKYIHKPWTAPALNLSAAGIILGKTYPYPIVDHDFARKRALDAFQSLTTPHADVIPSQEP